jgi:hypothetical protein
VSEQGTTKERGCKPLSSDELEDLQAAYWPGAEPNELRRKLIVAIMHADAKFEAAKVGGTKRWIEGFFLPALKEQGLAICPAQPPGDVRPEEC